MLTDRQRVVLREMIAAEDAGDRERAEIFCDGRSCYLGFTQVRRETVDGLVTLMAIRLSSEDGSCERYVVSETGRQIDRKPRIAKRIMAAVLAGTACDAAGNPV